MKLFTTMKVFARLRHGWPQFVADWTRIAPITNDKGEIKWPRFTPNFSNPSYCEIAGRSLWKFQKIGNDLVNELEGKKSGVIKVCRYYD